MSKSYIYSRNKILYRVYFISLLIIVFVLVLISNMNNTTINLPFKVKNIVYNVSVQGWGFFTRNPREEIIDIFSINNGRLTKLSVKNFSLHNYLGASRASRKTGFEISLILEAIIKQNLKWSDIKDPLYNDYIKLPVNNISLENNLVLMPKGEYILIKKNVTPWAWFGKENNFMPYEAIHIHLN